MDKKIRLTLSMAYDNETIANAMVSGLIYEHLLFAVREMVADAENVSKSDIYEALQNIASEGARVDYASLEEWTRGKDGARDELLALAVILDSRVRDAGGEASLITKQLSTELDRFAERLRQVEFKDGFAYLKDSGISSEMIETTLEQMSMVSENEFAIGLMDEDLNYEPFDTKSYTNSFIEKKLKKLDSIISRLSSKIDKDYTSLEDTVLDMEKRLYNVATSVATDTEKTDITCKILKRVNAHKQLVDKVENGLVEATEYSRQLTLHEGQLVDNDKKGLNVGISSGMPDDIEVKKLIASRVVSGGYRTRIENEKLKLDNLKLKLEKHRKVVEGVELAFRSSIPTEAELKKYSSIKHRLQDLQNRLDIASSQVVLDADGKELVGVNKSGLDSLAQIYADGKDVFMRNTLMSGIFSSVNALYSLGENSDKVIERSNKKFIGAKLLDYSIKNASLQKDLRTFRRIGDEVIRDIAIILGKPITLSNLKEMAEIQELAVHQSSQMLEMIEKNHKNEIELLTSILNI